jgi:hypothetical protein
MLAAATILSRKLEKTFCKNNGASSLHQLAASLTFHFIICLFNQLSASPTGHSLTCHFVSPPKIIFHRAQY